MKGDKLNPRKQRFIQEYLVDFNGTQAAIRAGYSKKTANEQAARLLANVNIQRTISEAQKETAAKLEITKEEWLAELIRIYRADMRDFIDIDSDTGATRAKGYNEMPEGAGRIISCIAENRTIKEDAKGQDSIIFARFKFKLHDKLKAGEMIGKHLGWLKDKIEGDISLRATLSMSDLKKSMATFKE